MIQHMAHEAAPMRNGAGRDEKSPATSPRVIRQPWLYVKVMAMPQATITTMTKTTNMGCRCSATVGFFANLVT